MDPAAQVPGGTRDLFPPIVAGLAVLTAVTAIVADPGTTTENVAAALAPVPVVVWARWPRRVPPVAAIVAVAPAVLVALGSGKLEMLLFVVSIAAVVAGGRQRSTALAAVALTVAVLTPVVAQIVSDEEIAMPIWILAMVMSWGLGRSDRTQVALGLELMQAREELARQAVLDERRRIAREVHDLVGHGLAAVMLQVTGARHVLRRDADAADEALAEAEATGRRSLHELGRTLSLLRADGDQDGAAPPVPGAGDIPALVDGGRPEGAGALRIDGDLDSIDPIVGLSLYRVTEEALTNARRHAPDADTDVVLAVADDHVVLTVESRGPLRSPDPADDRPRYGLVGMRERMTAVGGDLDVGPMPAGWIVRCRAPLTPARTAPGAGSRVAPHTADVGSGEGTDPDAAPKSADPGTPGQHPGDRHDEPGTDGRSAPLDTRPGGGT